MKIIIIGPAHPLRGGLASYNERLARAFQSEGHQVQICTFSLQYPDFLFPGTTQFSTEPAPENLDIRIKINSINPLNWILTGFYLKRQKADIIVVRYWLPFMGPCLGTLLRIAKSNKHTKVICIADNVIPHEKRPGDFWFTKYFIKPVDAFITMSHQVLEDLKTFTTKKEARMIPHPLYDNFGERIPKETARKHLSIPENAFVFLFFGFIRKYKGLDLLLEAILLLKEQNRLDPNTRFLIAGEFYDDSKHYESLLRNPKIAPQLILFTDFIPDSEVRYFLCAADAVVQPYRSATQSGVTPLAYHFEIPMVVTNVGGLPSLVPHGKSGLVCEPTANAIADALVELQKKGPESFKASLTQEKQKYSWQRMTEAIVELAQ